MSIASEIQRIKNNIAAAYSACDSKGATMPQLQNSNNLADTIGSIPASGGLSALDAYIEGSQTSITSYAGNIKPYAFHYDSKITSASFPYAVRLGLKAFENCNQLTSFSAPELTIGDTDAFYKCSQLSSVTLPKLSSIPQQFFRSCSSLTSLDLPLCSSVGYMGLAGCTSLSRVNLPTVSLLGDAAFGDCTSLTAIDLHNIGSINGNQALAYCSQLTAVVLRRTLNICRLGNVNVFEYTPFRNGTGGTVYVPQTLLSSYQSATNWSALESTTFLPIEGSIYEEASV